MFLNRITKIFFNQLKWNFIKKNITVLFINWSVILTLKITKPIATLFTYFLIDPRMLVLTIPVSTWQVRLYSDWSALIGSVYIMKSFHN